MFIILVTEKDATVPTDSNIYAGGAKVTVAGNATTTSDKKFLGWQLNGNVYKPGQSFEVNKDIANKDNQIILTATWGNAETSTTLTYNPGNGRGNLQTVNVMNNEAVEIEAHGSLGFSAPVAEGKEYYFAGWLILKQEMQLIQMDKQSILMRMVKMFYMQFGLKRLKSHWLRIVVHVLITVLNSQ